MMLGYVELSFENGVELCDKCLEVIKNYKYKYETKIESSWFGLHNKEVHICTNMKTFLCKLTENTHVYEPLPKLENTGIPLS